MADSCDATGLQAAASADPETLARRVNAIYHDLQADQFNQVHRRRHRVERVFWRSDVAARLAEAGSTSGVDLCSGTGFVPSVLLPILAPAATILCVDLSAGALQRAERTLAEFAGRVRYHAGDVAELPVPDASVDWVSLNASLHHIPAPAAVFREVDRVLAPGGYFCLGHEPNAAFFESRVPAGLERAIWHAFWYLSPARNLRRLRRMVGREVQEYEAVEHLDAINEALLREGLVDAPLTQDELRRIVDVHTHEDAEHEAVAGFRVEELIRQNLPGYAVRRLVFADYGGEMLRWHPWLRSAYDGLMRLLFPRKGRLFSWILRKPGH